MWTYTNTRKASLYLIVSLMFLAFSCVKASDNSASTTTLSMKPEDAKKWLIGVWKENGSGSLNGPDITYSWGKTKFDDNAFSIDLSATPAIISSLGIILFVDSYQQNGREFTFSLIDSSGREKETLSIAIESNGEIVFPNKAQKTVLRINTNRTYHKVDGPYRDWSIMR